MSHGKTGVDLVLEDLHDAENQLHLDLERIGERHAADHEVFHVTRDLARWSAQHVARLAEEGKRFGLDLDPTAASTNTVAAGVRRRTSTLAGRRHAPALMLIDDLRQIYGDASLLQLDWVLLGQVAKAVHDQRLTELAESCRAETERQVTWAQAKLKEAAPQALVTP
ncbi:MAG TPA: hypothetical protein VHO29_10330 [Marmoricola sp.]|nr:hypothetical protein [Marmoricola sp.]